MSLANDISNHKAYIKKLRQSGGNAFTELHSGTPSVDAGLFDYPVWVANKTYAVGDLFSYNGQIGFVRQAHTSQEAWLPFSVGTESLYGARPRQRPDGIYPYIYNMKAEVDMRVESVKDGKVYKCIQPADPLLYDPSDVPALFIVEN